MLSEKETLKRKRPAPSVDSDDEVISGSTQLTESKESAEDSSAQEVSEEEKTFGLEHSSSPSHGQANPWTKPKPQQKQAFVVIFAPTNLFACEGDLERALRHWLVQVRRPK